MSNELDYGQSPATATIWCRETTRLLQLEELATACRCVLLSYDRSADYLLADISSVADQNGQEWSEIAAYLEQSDAQALVWIKLGQLDTAFAALPVERCDFLIDADDALAVPILARANGRAKMDRLHDNSREGGYDALHKISDELADFARTLARIAEQEGTVSSTVRDKPVSFRPAPTAIFDPLVPTAPVERGPTAQAIRELIKLRRMREQHFPADLFADPGWDILLDLFAAKLEGKSVSVSSLCIAAAVPPTTGLRWITTMTEHGALVRRQDPNDARRVFIELSADSEERLRAFFSDAEARGGLIL
jgi:hypothetical protein